MSAAVDAQWKHVQTGLLMLASMDALRLSVPWQFGYPHYAFASRRRAHEGP